MSFYDETYQQRPEASTPYPDWVGVLGSPYAADQASQSPGDASGSVESFDRDIDLLSLDLDLINQTHLTCQQDTTIDWQSVFNTALPFAPGPPDPFADNMSSCEGTIIVPLSPASDGTLINSPANFPLPDFKLPPTEDGLLDGLFDHHVASSSAALCTANAFPAELLAPTPASHMHPVMFDAHNGYDDNGQFYWPEQPLSQHMVDVANAVVSGLTTGVEANVHEFTFASIAPASPLPLPNLPPKHPQDVLVVEDKKPTCPTRTKRCRVEDDNDSDSANEDDAPPKRKRKQQDTTPRFACCECGKLFGRTHNREVHYQTVHLGLRPFPCKEPGCDRAFSRKHDLNRHHQSAHTKLGSPRKAENAKPSNSNKGKKIVKKDEPDA